MKIVLSIHEANDIIASYLVTNGKLENKETDVHWCIADGNEQKSYIEFEQ